MIPYMLGVNLKGGQSAIAVCIRGLSKIEMKTQIRAITLCKAQGGLPTSFYGYYEVSTTR